MNAIKRHADPPRAKPVTPLGAPVPPAYPRGQENDDGTARDIRVVSGFVHGGTIWGYCWYGERPISPKGE